MAFMNQQRKAERMENIKWVLREYGMKGSVSVHDHSTLVVTLREGEIDFGTDYGQVNTYWIHEHYEGVARDFLEALKDAMLGHDYYNNSDIQTDYFDVSHYININIGRYNKPYQVITQKETA